MILCLRFVGVMGVFLNLYTPSTNYKTSIARSHSKHKQLVTNTKASLHHNLQEAHLDNFDFPVTKGEVQEYYTHMNISFPAVWFIGIVVGILDDREEIPLLSQESYKVPNIYSHLFFSQNLRMPEANRASSN